MSTVETSGITLDIAQPKNGEGDVDYAQDPGLDRYRKTPTRQGLDALTIKLAVLDVNESARSRPPVTWCHGALAVHDVVKVYL